MSKNNHHGDSPWREVLIIAHPMRTVPIFRINTHTHHTDGGITNSGLLHKEIDSVLSTPGATAEIRCYEAFVLCAMKEGFLFTKKMAEKIQFRNRGKLLESIYKHRSEPSIDPAHLKNLDNLLTSVKKLPLADD